MKILEILAQVADKVGNTGGGLPLLPRIAGADPQQLGEFLPLTHHAVLSIWHYALPDERALAFLGPSTTAGKQRIRTDLIHQLFPRATLLTERHRKASSCRGSFSCLSIEVCSDHNKNDYVSWTQWPKARLALSEPCWKELLPPDFLIRFENTVERIERILGSEPEKNWHHVVDAGRTLREEFANWLHLCRRQIGNQAGKELLPAVSGMADWEQVKNCRHREFPDVPLDRLASKEITWFVDSETIDDFLGLLQALRCYMGDNRHLVSWLWKYSGGNQALAVLAVAESTPPPNHKAVLGSANLGLIYTSHFLPRMTEAQKHLATNAPGRTQEEVRIPDDIERVVNTWLSRPSLNRACGMRLVALAKELAEKHAVHEGRQLHYRFIYASSASLWPEIEEVLSFEAASDYPRGTGQTISDQAKSLEAHWSIFQPERVFGIIDALSNSHGDQPRIQRVVRVRPPAKWSGLESEAMDGLAKASKPCLTLVVLRQWMVRLSFSRDGVKTDSLLWDVRKQKPEPPDSVQELAQTLATAAGIAEARVRSVLATVLSEVSEAASEGALLIAVGNGNVQDVVRRTCMEMDSPENQMAWRNNKQLRWVDRTLLRAMLILDGATVIQPNCGQEAIVRPRLVVYPFVFCRQHPSESTGFSVISWKPPEGAEGCGCPRPAKDLLTSVQKRLVGKGSRKHGGANISVLLQNAGGESCVVSVSADGPIEKWPEPAKIGHNR